MIYNKNYFIYDEKNYTQLDIYGEKMITLRNKQYNTYQKNGLSNYIFIIESLDEEEQSLEYLANELSESIKLELDYYNKHNYILAIFVMSSHKIKFYAGTSAIKKITLKEQTNIINNITPYMKSGDYYKTWTKVIDDYNYYYNYDSDSRPDSDSDKDSDKNNNGNNESNDPLSVFVTILVFAVFITGCVICHKKGWCNFLSSSDNNTYTRSTDIDTDNNNNNYNNYNNNNNDNYDNNNNDNDNYDNNNNSNDNNNYDGGRSNSVASGGAGGTW